MKPQDDDKGLDLTPMNLVPIDVNVDGLNDFRSFLIRELDANLKPGVEGINNDHGMGAHFGVGNPGVQVQAARKRYTETLEAATNNLTQYVNAAEILIEAIQQVATKYGDADLSASAALDGVGKELLDALATATQIRVDAPGLEIDQETQRELNRMRSGAGQ